MVRSTTKETLKSSNPISQDKQIGLKRVYIKFQVQGMKNGSHANVDHYPAKSQLSPLKEILLG